MGLKEITLDEKWNIITHIYEFYQGKVNTICTLSQNSEFVQTHCNDRNNSLHFSYREWFLYNNRQCW